MVEIELNEHLIIMFLKYNLSGINKLKAICFNKITKVNRGGII